MLSTHPNRPLHPRCRQHREHPLHLPGIHPIDPPAPRLNAVKGEKFTVDRRQAAESTNGDWFLPANLLRQGNQPLLGMGHECLSPVGRHHLPPRGPHPPHAPGAGPGRVEKGAEKAMEEGEEEDTAVDPVGVGIGEDQEPLEAEGVGAEVLPGTDTEGRRQGAKQRLLRDAPGGGPQRIEWFPLHRQDCLEPAIADAGHCQSGRFPLDNEQFGTGIRAVDLAVEEFDRTTMKGMRHC